jgi:hypothetical protein
MAVSSGNQLHAFYWTDSLFLWHASTESDAPSVASVPFRTMTPANKIAVSQMPTATPISIATQIQGNDFSDLPASGKPINPTGNLIAGVIVASLCTAVVLTVKLIRQRWH